MIPSFIKKITGSEKKLNDKSAKKFLSMIARLSTLSDEIKKHQEEKTLVEYEILSEDKKNLYISLDDFFSLVEVKNLTLDDIISKCVHTSEIRSTNFSVVDIYAIYENEHLVLCPNPKECALHSSYHGDKIRIVTAKSV
jgi:RNA binding exosome subunit